MVMMEGFQMLPCLGGAFRHCDGGFRLTHLAGKISNHIALSPLPGDLDALRLNVAPLTLHDLESYTACHGSITLSLKFLAN